MIIDKIRFEGLICIIIKNYHDNCVRLVINIKESTQLALIGTGNPCVVTNPYIIR